MWTLQSRTAARLLSVMFQMQFSKTKTHFKLIKKRRDGFIGILSNHSKGVITAGVHPSIHGLPHGNHLLLLYCHYTLFPSASFDLFNYSDCWNRDTLAAPENNADKNALNLSAKGNTIRIIDGCNMRKEGRWRRASVLMWTLNDAVWLDFPSLFRQLKSGNDQIRF